METDIQRTDLRNSSTVGRTEPTGHGDAYSLYLANGTDNFTESSMGECVAYFNVTGYPDLTQLQAVHVSFVILYLLVMVLAFFGNSVVIWIVWKHKSMHTATNYYIVSLAVSDFFVSIFVLPTKLMELGMDTDISPFKDSIALCSVMQYLQPIFVFASIWTLVAVSVDRYLAIIHPLKARSFGTKSRARKIIVAIWTVGCLLMAPYLYPSCLFFYYLESDYGSVNRIICTPQFHDFGAFFVKGWHIFLMLILYFFPLTLLCICYGIMATRLLRMTKEDKMLHNKDFQHSRQSKSRRKLAKMVIVVVIVFCTCWAPHFVSSMVTIFKPMVWEKRNYIFGSMLNHLFGFANSSLNPVIYAIMSEKFREGFKHIAIQVITCRQRTSSTYGHRLVRNQTLMSSGRSSVDREDNQLDPPGGALTETAGGATSRDKYSQRKQHFVGSSGRHGSMGTGRERDTTRRSRGKRNNSRGETKVRERSKNGGNTFTLSFRNDHYTLTRSSSSPQTLINQRERLCKKTLATRHPSAGNCSRVHDYDNIDLKQSPPKRFFVPIVHYGSTTPCNFKPTIFVEDSKRSLSTSDLKGPGREGTLHSCKSGGNNGGEMQQSLLDGSNRSMVTQRGFEDARPEREDPPEPTENPDDANYVCLSLVTDTEDICFEEEVLNRFIQTNCQEIASGDDVSGIDRDVLLVMN
ncbi:uncharacterized protein [Ptychodera flava]|uniref:uncharacterized protein n=1 Tax=Ptychodera flava TaxID=63121 RepID=UPI003969C9A5